MRTAALNLLVIAIAEHWVVDVEVKNKAGGGGGGAGGGDDGDVRGNLRLKQVEAGMVGDEVVGTFVHVSVPTCNHIIYVLVRPT